jgi:hypothetical protein
MSNPIEPTDIPAPLRRLAVAMRWLGIAASYSWVLIVAAMGFWCSGSQLVAGLLAVMTIAICLADLFAVILMVILIRKLLPEE